MVRRSDPQLLEKDVRHVRVVVLTGVDDPLGHAAFAQGESAYIYTEGSLAATAGGALVTWVFTFTAAAYNIVRLRRLLEATA